MQLNAPLGTPLANHWQALGDNRYQVHLSELTQLEPLLAQLRQAGIGLLDLAIQQPNLEDVFLQVMHKDAA